MSVPPYKGDGKYPWGQIYEHNLLLTDSLNEDNGENIFVMIYIYYKNPESHANSGADKSRKRKSKKTVKGPSTYNLGYFTLWWGRMDREGRKYAEERKCRAEDHAASRGMQMFLGCGKRMKDGQKIPRTEAKTLKTLEQNESDEMTTGRTQEIVPPKNDLSSFTYGGKRMLEGGLDSPSKSARVYVTNHNEIYHDNLISLCLTMK